MGSTEIDALKALEVSEDFAGAEQSSLEQLARSMKRRELPAQSVVFEQGARSDVVYLLADGRVRLTSELESGRQGMIAELGAGEILGDMTALTDRPRTAMARTTTDAVLFEIPATTFRDVLQSDSKLAVNLMCSAMDLVLEKDISFVATSEERAELQRAVDVERESVQRLRESGAMKDEQVAMMAHDLRAPMTVILGCSEVLLERWRDLDEERREEFLRTISRSARGLAELVEDALQVSALEAGEVAFEIQVLDIVALARRVVGEFGHSVPGRTIDLDATGEIQVKADERRQWQILTNLLSNAVKFSDADQPIEVQVRRDNGGARVSVVDKGRGIGPESMRHLFKKFSRIPDPEGVKKPPGTGLGLYICDLLVRAQGGQIWAESTPGGGSTFTYTIPTA